ncbi:hypothetical protein [Pseudomonas sp. NCCP-436]|uniref:hypothetical protein n=1 Tax=Pseudomonas sp. NCCP-436 TaxID=2842481 RepID=UPI001C827453|nr:hypothetical protein [Pseudomonas sp. NCCP-436]GIZ13338.1 hypothetical protein NCCP436_27540 [Pseudomonas sp. NCCP-436]
MSNPLPDQAAQTIAVLTACLVQTIGKTNPEFIPAFEQSLQEMYANIRENSYFPPETLQAVKLVGGLLKNS